MRCEASGLYAKCQQLVNTLYVSDIYEYTWCVIYITWCYITCFHWSDRELMVYLVIYRSSKSFCQLSFHYDLPKDQREPNHLDFLVVLSRQSNSRSTESRRSPSGWELHQLLLTALCCVLPVWSVRMVFSCLGIYRRAWDCYVFF